MFPSDFFLRYFKLYNKKALRHLLANQISKKEMKTSNLVKLMPGGWCQGVVAENFEVDWK